MYLEVLFMNKHTASYGPLLLRLVLGALFLVTGITKLLNPAIPTGMLTNIGFPAPGAFAWILLLSEILFGLAVLLGYNIKLVVWPLVLVLVVATGLVYLPGFSKNIVTILFHLLGIAALASLSLTGSGAFSVTKD